MRRIAIAATLAGFGLIACSAPAAANDGPGTFGMGFRGYSLFVLPFIHQHGPLFNYGPYYGYPPFEPYGNWNAYLQYTGPIAPPVGAKSPNAYGWIHGSRPSTFGHGFPHPLNLGNGGRLQRGSLLHRNGGVFHGASTGCSSCSAAAQKIATSGDPIARFNGVGAPTNSKAFYAEGPSIITVGFPGR